MTERKIFRNLVSVEEANSLFYKHLSTHMLSTEEVPLLDALNRILADDIFSPIDVPPFDRAAMDGFAVK
ncbi:MAG: molybdopterin biosynthesis protein, partial [Candidatus Kariarchaeaceae archaeon]